MRLNQNILTQWLRLIRLTFLAVCLAGCEKALDLQKPKSDALSVFNEAWNVIDQHYALFPVKNVDWIAAYNTWRPEINKNLTEKQLFEAIDKMLETLKDGHLSLMSPTDTATYLGFYQLHAPNFDYNNLVNTYLHNDYKTIGPVIYKIQNNVGYLYYRSFKQDITDAQADQLFHDLHDTKGLIIDVRNNQGGNSANADRIFQRLVPARELIKYEKIKRGPGHDDYFDPQPYYLSPAGAAYQHPVCVLTNRSCFSACNDFVLYLTSLPNVKIVGDTTGGGGGIPKDYVLANGWKLQYTSTMTLSPGKTTVENGIPPNVMIGINSLDQARGIDSILETAYRLLQ